MLNKSIIQCSLVSVTISPQTNDAIQVGLIPF